MKTKFERYRVKPGTRVDLGKVPTRDDAAFKSDKGEGQARLEALTYELAALQQRLHAEGRQKLLVILQAMDTAGKDSTVRDVFNRTNPMGVDTVAFGPPSTYERAHDYLWRVHPHTPSTGRISIFNRSHYEDVLVVRVEGLVPKHQWKRRFGHIRNFEQMLADEGVVIRKFFLHISRAEQKERLEERLTIKEKHWKFDGSDLSNRARWDDYIEAYEQAISETSTDDAPWYVIPSDRRWYRKLAVANIVVATLADMDPQYPDGPDLSGMVIPD
jgi:PPK2 family polyphosphate:nucleotide phosphotransferase